MLKPYWSPDLSQQNRQPKEFSHASWSRCPEWRGSAVSGLRVVYLGWLGLFGAELREDWELGLVTPVL